MRSTACVVYKEKAKYKRRKGIQLKAQALQEISPNNTVKTKDNHVYRPYIGCDVCKVNLCSSSRSTRQCWRIYHEDQKIGGEN